MYKEFFLFIKYPYTAGTIGIIWLGSAALMAIDRDLDLVNIIIVNMITSVIIAGLGFRGPAEM